MRQVTLQFSDILEMVEFQNITDTFNCPSDTERLLLTCTLSDSAIELAKKGYDAKVLQMQSV